MIIEIAIRVHLAVLIRIIPLADGKNQYYFFKIKILRPGIDISLRSIPTMDNVNSINLNEMT